MRYEDASHSGQGQAPIANDDLEIVAAGSKSSATGNLITGDGTQTGTTGADSAAGGHITAIAGKGGEDSSFAGGKLSVDGEYGKLSVDAEGNYVYQANKGVENVRDRFTYTLADNQGATDNAVLIVEIGKTPFAIKADAQQIVPGPDGVVTLPPGVELSDVHVVGRNLVIDMPDGTQLIIIDGAVFVPQLVLGGVEVPATNVAALLVGQEIQPAAGENPPSSGGNFGVPPPPLDPGVPLGDLIPPTEYGYTPPDVEEIGQELDREPEAGAATAILDDDAQAGGIAGGVGDDAGTNFDSGVLPGSGGDGALEWNLLPSGTLPAGFSFSLQPNGDLWILQGVTHVMTITVNEDTGAFTVTQLAAIDHPAGGDENNLNFVINYSVTDQDGDTAIGTLTVNADDDTPTIDVTVASDANVVLLTQDAQTDGDPTDTDTATTSANFGGIFGASSAYGADGAGTTTLTYALSTTGGAANLSSHGVAINLYNIGGVIVGSTAATAGAVNASNTIFDVSVDANTGVVTLHQYAQIDHPLGQDPSPPGPGYEDQLISLADGAITLTRTGSITDGDGDTVTDSASVGIGANIKFADDGPSIDPTLNRVSGAVVDESAPVDPATIPLVGGYTRGDDPHLSGDLAIGKGSTSGPVIDANAAFGADGPAAGGGISYALDVLNSVSGLTTTEGVAINLVELSNGVVVGVVDGTTTVAFAVQIDSATGVVTVEQYLSIFHPDSPDNFDEPVFLNEGSLGVTVSATDFDGDSVTSDAVDITSLIRFEDDGPSIDPVLNANATVTVDESLPSDTPGINTGAIVKGDDPDLAGGLALGQGNSGAAIVNANAVFGADGPAAQGSLLYSLSITNPDPGVTLTDGTSITMTLVNGVIVGVVDSGPFDGQAAFAISINPTTGVVTVEQYLSLDHPVNPNPNDPLGLGDNSVAVNVTATDGDGDHITSGDIDISGQITFLDDGPSVAPTLNANATVTVDESLPSNTPGINTGAIVKGDDPDLAGGIAIGQANSGGAIVDAHAVFGADGPAAGGGLSYALVLGASDTPLTLTDGSTITLSLVGGVVVGVVDNGPFAGQAAFAIAINSSTGVVTVEQYLSLDHPVNPDPNDPLGLGDNTIGVTVTATDGDGDPVTSNAVDVSHQITFLDDGPSIDPVLDREATVTVDESLPSTAPAINTGAIVKGDDPDLAGGLALGQGNSGVAIVDANAVFGADGPAAGGGISYALSITNVSSGLTLTDGSAINLQLVGGVVVGVVASGAFAGQAAFAIAINSTTGVVSVEQYLSLDHPVNPDPNDPLGLGDNTVAVTVTATDGDGDPVTSGAIDISDNITFLDDGPTADPVVNVNGAVTVDESLPSSTPGLNTGAIVKGDDPDLAGGLALGQATGGAAIVNANAVFGADGPQASGSVSYALSILNVNSGLTLTDGTPITLTNVNGVIVGVVNGGTFNGQAAFAIAINSSTGVVTVEQYLSLDHPLNPNPNDPLSFGTNVIGATVTVTDGDGDPVTSNAVDIGGQLTFLDDGPSANNDTDTTSNITDTAVGNVITGVGTNEGAANADVTGADGFGAISNLVGFGGSTDSNPAGGFSVNGQWGTLQMDANGQYTYTRTGGAGGATDTFTYTYVDGDGDPATATLTITLADNTPTLPDPATILLDDDVIPGKNGNLDGPGDDNPDNIGGNVVNGQLAGSGGDGALTYSFTGVNTLPLGFTVNVVDGDTIQVLQGATVVMTIDLNLTTGAFTVTQNNPIMHPSLDGQAGDDTENNLNFSIGVQVKDSDNDTDPATITINVDDDTPTINVTKGDDSAVSLTTDDAQTIGAASDTATTSANFGGVFGLTQSIGADGGSAATLNFALGVSAPGVDSGLNSHGVDIHLYLIGGVVVGSTALSSGAVDASNTIFNVSVSGTGVVTLTQFAQIDHAPENPSGSPFNDQLATTMVDNLITLTASSTITDNDGDSASDSETVNIGANLHFTDDGPTAGLNTGAPLDTIVLDETRPVGTDTPSGSAPNGLASSTANFADNFSAVTNYGADGPGTTVYTLSLSANGIASGLFALQPSDIIAGGDGDGYGQGASITLSINAAGTLITGSANGTDYFTISINQSTGVVTFTQLNPIWHPTQPSNFDEAVTLTTANPANVAVVQTVTDFDGDTASASLSVGAGVFTIQDDGPQAIQPDSATLENEAGATVTSDLDDDGEVITDFGEDGAGLVQFANIVNGDDSGFTSGGDNIEYFLSNNGQTLQARTNSTNGSDGELIFTVQINQATGDYTVTMTGTVDNGAGISFDNLTSSKAGNVDVRAVGADDPSTPVDLLLTASLNGANATINTDSDSIGAGNQSMDQGETVRIDFVNNAVTNAGLPSGFGYDSHATTHSYEQTIPQVQGAQSETVAFRVYALNTTVTQAGSPDDTPVAGNPAFSDSSTVAITTVSIDGYNDGPDDGTPNEPMVTVALGPVGTWTTIAYGVSARLESDGSVTFTGIQQGDRYGIDTGVNGFNAVAVTSLPAGVGPAGGQSTTNSFDLGVLAIGQVETGDPINLNFDLKITDADGDSITMTDAIAVTINPASDGAGFAATSFRMAGDEDLQKTAANSNSLTMATAVAAAGMADSLAAAPPSDSHLTQVTEPQVFSTQVVDRVVADDEGDSQSSLAAAPESQEADQAQGNSGGHGKADEHRADASVDAAAGHGAANNGSAHDAANDQGPAVAAPQVAAPAAVAMVSADALQAAASLDGAQHNSVVEKVVAEALGHGNGHGQIDALLDAFHGGNGGNAANANLASAANPAVSAWDMASDGGSSGSFEVLMKVGAQMLHHDMVQPTHNG